MELTLEQTQARCLVMTSQEKHQSEFIHNEDGILLEPSTKSTVMEMDITDVHEVFEMINTLVDESKNTHVLEQILLLSGNPDQEILLKLNLYLITGSIYTDQRGTVVIATVFDEVTKTLSSISVDYH
ncbi:hypothetical protein Tco_0690342 [Tanacetum coccineum]